MKIFSLGQRFSNIVVPFANCSFVMNDRGELSTKDKIGDANELVSLRLVFSE